MADLRTLSTEQLIDRYGTAALKCGRSNSGLCISATASSDWEWMQALRAELKRRFNDAINADLLTACEAIVAAWESIPERDQVNEEMNLDGMWANARAAIEKAKGGTA